VTTVSSTLKAIESISGVYGNGVNNNTPVAIVREMIDKLDYDWSDPNLTIFDPACGYGTFLLITYEKLREHGHSSKHIVENMLYGNDIDIKKATIAASLLSKLAENDITIYNEDALAGGFDNMQFNVVIGNPPYQKIKEKGEREVLSENLWTIFLSKSITTWTSDNGIVAMVTPSTWISPSNDLKGNNKINNYGRLWDYFNSVSTYADVKNVSKHFKVGSTFCYVIVDKSGTDGLKFSEGETTELGFLPKSGIEEVKDKIDLNNNLKKYFEVNSEQNGLRVRFPLTKSLTESLIEITDKPEDPQDKTWWFGVKVNTAEEAEKVRTTIINSIDVLNKHCRWVGPINKKIVGLLKYVG